MFKYITIVFLALFSLLASPQRISSEELHIKEVPKVLTIQETIIKYADVYSASEEELMDVARCESKYDPKVIGDNGRAYGIYQYHKGTFDSFAKEMGEKLDYKSVEDQAKLTAWVFANKPKDKNHWTAYRALKNGGTYKFYSKLLKKSFTVTCKPEYKKSLT